jgi:hypothetical protein
MAEWSKDHVAAIGSLKLNIFIGKVREWVCGKPTPPRL